MKLKARIHLTPRHDLDESADRRVRGMVEDFITRWNARGETPVRDGSVILTHDGRTYRKLRDSFLEWVRRDHVKDLLWSEILRASYAPSELFRYEILTLHINGSAGLGGNAYAHVYDYETCPSCGLITIQSQRRDLVTNLTGVTMDFASTLNFSEVLVSERLRDLFLKERITGIDFRPVEHAHPSRPARYRYFQLTVRNVLSSVSAADQTFDQCPAGSHSIRRQTHDLERPDPWTEIRRWPPGPWSELHFSRADYRGWNLTRTPEIAGGPPSPTEPAPRFSYLIASRQLYGSLLKNKITGFWVEPAHLDNEKIH